MQMTHEWDQHHLEAIGLPALRVFRAVAECESFTKAGDQIGLSQSATSRAVAQLEESLGIPLFERTTRRVSPTPAGAMLYQETGSHIVGIEHALASVRQNFGDTPPILRVGIARSVGLAYLPGLFHAYTREFPHVLVETFHGSDQELTHKLAAGELDTAIATNPLKIPSGIKPALTFQDSYIVIAPENFDLANSGKPLSLKRSRKTLTDQRWLGLPASDPAAILTESHFASCDIQMTPALIADSYDLLINLVALGMGIACVPNRALAIYRRQRRLKMIPIRPKLSRELAILTRKSRILPDHIQGFVDRVLFALK